MTARWTETGHDWDTELGKQPRSCLLSTLVVLLLVGTPVYLTAHGIAWAVTA